VGVVDGWRYCPRCASELAHVENRVECAECGLVHYAASFPTVSAFILDGEGRVLLARRASEPDAGKWDAPGGFLEEGEEALEGLERELAEETGLTIEPTEFVGAFVDSYGDGARQVSVLNLVWAARVVAGDPAPADDVEELRWFPRDELPPVEELAFRWLAPNLESWLNAPSKAS
jgi:ADP-ribose pyrophosphatase YjhB (NUDIX family)